MFSTDVSGDGSRWNGWWERHLLGKSESSCKLRRATCQWSRVINLWLCYFERGPVLEILLNVNPPIGLLWYLDFPLNLQNSIPSNTKLSLKTNKQTKNTQVLNGKHARKLECSWPRILQHLWGSWNTTGPASFSTYDEAGMQLVWDPSAPIIATPVPAESRMTIKTNLCIQGFSVLGKDPP